jgi:hypothetical protein
MILRIIERDISAMRFTERFFETGFYTSKRFYLLLFGLLLALMTLRQHLVTNYNCEICADKAGYYIYLVAAFGPGFHADAYPGNPDHDHGDGFYLDREKNTVKTKFTSGIAILLAPFFAVGVLLAKIFSIDADFYSKYYLFFVNLGAAFYAVTGLYCFRKFLEFYVSRQTAFVAMLVALAGTNLLYYTLDETLMSHLYSFSLFSVMLYGMKMFLDQKRTKYMLLLLIALALAVLIRPTNMLFAVIVLFLDVSSFATFKNKCAALFTSRNMASAGIIFFLVFLPQMLYWKFAFDNYLVWSYEGEGFSNWKDPWVMTVWFSTQSGAFLYTPVLFIALFFAVIMLKNKTGNGLVVIGSFLVVTYLCAAWHNPYFGLCNFGKRPFVDYLPVFLLPAALLIDRLKKFTPPVKYAVAALLIFFVYYNIALFAGFDTCFPGGQWDWNEFSGFAGRALLLFK